MSINKKFTGPVNQSVKLPPELGKLPHPIVGTWRDRMNAINQSVRQPNALHALPHPIVGTWDKIKPVNARPSFYSRIESHPDPYYGLKEYIPVRNGDKNLTVFVNSVFVVDKDGNKIKLYNYRSFFSENIKVDRKSILIAKKHYEGYEYTMIIPPGREILISKNLIPDGKFWFGNYLGIDTLTTDMGERLEIIFIISKEDRLRLIPQPTVSEYTSHGGGRRHTRRRTKKARKSRKIRRHRI